MEKWQMEFPMDVQEERKIVLAAIDCAMDEATPEAVRAVGEMAWAWVARHPEDYAVWDAGEPLALLADVLQTTTIQEPEMAGALSH